MNRTYFQNERRKINQNSIGMETKSETSIADLKRIATNLIATARNRKNWTQLEEAYVHQWTLK